MTKEEIIAKVKTLNLPAGAYVIFGSCPMAALGLREAADIDILASPEVYAKLKVAGWQVLEKGGRDRPLVRDNFEVHDNWEFSEYSPTLAQLLSSATVIDGVAFASLEEVKKWKMARGKEKDLADIKLIDIYFANKTYARS